MICLPVSDRSVAITYLDHQKGGEVIIYQKEKEGEVTTFKNNNMEDEETKYVVLIENRFPSPLSRSIIGSPEACLTHCPGEST